MQYLHQNNFSHRDLKPSNILLNNNYFPIIGDFGFSIYSTSDFKATSMKGSPLFCAPEIRSSWNLLFTSSDTSESSKKSESISEPCDTSESSQKTKSTLEPYDPKKADVYSFGVVLSCLFIESFNSLFEFLLSYEFINSFLDFIQDGTIKNLIEQFCDKNPEKRPDFDHIVQVMKQKKEIQMHYLILVIYIFMDMELNKII